MRSQAPGEMAMWSVTAVATNSSIHAHCSEIKSIDSMSPGPALDLSRRPCGGSLTTNLCEGNTSRNTLEHTARRNRTKNHSIAMYITTTREKHNTKKNNTNFWPLKSVPTTWLPVSHVECPNRWRFTTPLWVAGGVHLASHLASTPGAWASALRGLSLSLWFSPHFSLTSGDSSGLPNRNPTEIPNWKWEKAWRKPERG